VDLEHPRDTDCGLDPTGFWLFLAKCPFTRPWHPQPVMKIRLDPLNRGWIDGPPAGGAALNEIDSTHGEVNSTRTARTLWRQGAPAL
jgi:hypothetical protein